MVVLPTKQNAYSTIMTSCVEATTRADGPLLCKSEVELRETEDNKRKALEQLTKYLVKHTKPSKNNQNLCYTRNKHFNQILYYFFDYPTVWMRFPPTRAVGPVFTLIAKSWLSGTSYIFLMKC